MFLLSDDTQRRIVDMVGYRTTKNRRMMDFGVSARGKFVLFIFLKNDKTFAMKAKEREEAQ